MKIKINIRNPKHVTWFPSLVSCIEPIRIESDPVAYFYMDHFSTFYIENLLPKILSDNIPEATWQFLKFDLKHLNCKFIQINNWFIEKIHRSYQTGKELAKNNRISRWDKSTFDKVKSVHMPLRFSMEGTEQHTRHFR